MAAKGPIERALAKLQAAIREGPCDDDRFPGRSGQVPKDLQTDKVRVLAINARDEALRDEAAALLLADERFEHLEQRGADAATWRFVCLAFLERSTNHVPTFMSERAREPGQHTLYMPIESLEVSEEQALGTVRLLPLDHPEVADGKLGFVFAPPIGAIIATPVTGTDAGRMIDRGRAAAQQALRVLRVGLREHHVIVDRQLRFRLSHLLSFGEGLAGFRVQSDAAWNLPLGAEDFTLVVDQPLARLYVPPTNKLERQAQLALGWMERALLATDPTVELLFWFSALEALLGGKQEGLKAPALAFRRAMLSVATRGSFADPGRVYGLYGQVRSAAIHGEEPPAVAAKELTAFAWDARRALNQYFAYAAEIGASKRSALIRALHAHEQAPELIEWLRSHGHPSWAKYLDQLDPPPADD